MRSTHYSNFTCRAYKVLGLLLHNFSVCGAVEQKRNYIYHLCVQSFNINLEAGIRLESTLRSYSAEALGSLPKHNEASQCLP